MRAWAGGEQGELVWDAAVATCSTFQRCRKVPCHAEPSSMLSDPGNPRDVILDTNIPVLLKTYCSDLCSTFLLRCYV